MAYALGLGDALVGVSHECDYPLDAKTKPVVSRPALDLDGLSLAEIDRAIGEQLGRGESIYHIDEALLRSLEPDLIVTQDLCQVCAPSGNELSVALRSLKRQPAVLFMSPHSLAEIERDVLALGGATGRSDEAHAIVARMKARLAAIAATVAGSPRTRVFFAEWVDPMFCSGHWVPEMVELAGGVDTLGRTGADSVRVAWEAVLEWAPEVVIVAPCGFHEERAREQIAQLTALQGWTSLPAVRDGRVHAVDADAYFARPGPRVVDGVEVLARLIHPECFAGVTQRGSEGALGRSA
jgi:iron complex transport system substrate-binding protein